MLQVVAEVAGCSQCGVLLSAGMLKNYLRMRIYAPAAMRWPFCRTSWVPMRRTCASSTRRPCVACMDEYKMSRPLGIEWADVGQVRRYGSSAPIWVDVD